ncbi:MAG: hypothetical protein QOG31_593 [Thermoplasmata archaeon]|jgi:predicted transcriptional regulator|nr:hypothetical protein [Thermoplasmata archaeon]
MVLFLLASSAGAAPIAGTEVQFSSPALLDGELRAMFPGQLLVLAGRAQGEPFSLVFGSDMEGTLTNATGQYAYFRGAQGGGSYPAPQTVGSEHVRIPKGTLLSLARPAGGSMFVDARSIKLEGAVRGAQLVPAPPDGDLSPFLPFQAGEVMETRGVVVDPAESVVALGGGAVRVLVEGLRSLAWTNAEVACPRSPCPAGGGWTAREVSQSGLVVREGAVSFMEFTPSAGGGAVSASGAASQVLLASLDATLALGGSVHLPQASTDLGCPACLGPANRTLSASGDLVLAHARHGDGRMAAVLGGDIRAARLDERAVDLPLLLGEGVLGVTAAASLAVAVKVLLGLFTKLKGDPLEHPRRRSIYEYIQAHPGANFREVARGVGSATGTTRHHLTVLKRNGVVMERAHGGTTRFFENHGKFEATWPSVVLLREAPLRQLHDWLAAHPGAAQKEVLEAMAQAGWSRSTTQHRLHRLVAGGAVELRPQGRLKMYRASAQALPEPVAQPARAPGSGTL